jgi:hypothetical protein
MWEIRFWAVNGMVRLLPQEAAPDPTTLLSCHYRAPSSDIISARMLCKVRPTTSGIHWKPREVQSGSQSAWKRDDGTERSSNRRCLDHRAHSDLLAIRPEAQMTLVPQKYQDT